MPRGRRKFYHGKWETGPTKRKQIVPCIPYPVIHDVSKWIIKGAPDMSRPGSHKEWKKIDRYLDMLHKRVCPMRKLK